MKKFICLLLFVTTLSAFAASEKISSKIVKSGDNVVFVGDSITHGGHAVEHIMLYYITRYPDMRVKFVNLGIGGDSAGGLMRRMNNEILPVRPNVSFLMIGMNDCNRDLYSQKTSLLSEAKTKKIADTNSRYRKNLESVIDSLSKNSRTLVLFTPSIYDQTAKIPSESFVGVNDALKLYGQYGREIAATYKNIIVADIWAEMQRVNESMQSRNPQATIVGADRVHPSTAGGFLMAYKFLADADENGVVAKAVIKAGNAPEIVSQINCEIADLQTSATSATFKMREFALPMVLNKRADDAEMLCDFQESLNREILKIKGLNKGDYALYIDGKPVGAYSAGELSSGVNLAGNDKTPQYAQSAEVSKLCSQIRGSYGAQRTLYFVEHLLMNGKIDDFNDVNKCVTLAEKMLPAQKGYGKYALEFYIKNKSKERELLDAVFALENKAYAAAQPKAHLYEIKAK